jgi:hypothetical protein
MASARFVRCAAVVLACVLTAGVASAHSLSPSLLVLRERGGGDIDVTWKTPLMQVPGANLRPALPVDCAVTVPPEVSEESDSVTARWQLRCASAGIVGRQIGVEGLGAAKTDALLHVELADGRTIDTVLRAREPTFTVPGDEHAAAVARHYVALGVEHIATGYGHLLFVLGLLLLVSDGRALLATLIAFTIGHSVTLATAGLGLARVPAAPVEALIAFSIYLLAVELARADTGSRLWRQPWLMAMAFGFLHGLGFAAALGEAGLPARAIPLALLGFNVGIELGQLAFVVTVLGLYRATRALGLPTPRWTRTLTVYTIGSLAAFWMLERALPLAGLQWLR